MFTESHRNDRNQSRNDTGIVVLVDRVRIPKNGCAYIQRDTVSEWARPSGSRSMEGSRSCPSVDSDSLENEQSLISMGAKLRANFCRYVLPPPVSVYRTPHQARTTQTRQVDRRQQVGSCAVLPPGGYNREAVPRRKSSASITIFGRALDIRVCFNKHRAKSTEHPGLPPPPSQIIGRVACDIFSVFDDNICV